MTTSQFLSQLVKDTNKYSLTESDNKTIQREGIKKFIFYRLNSTKYRAQATSEDYLQKVIDKISLSVDCREPLHITLPFGATKNPYLPKPPASTGQKFSTSPTFANIWPRLPLLTNMESYWIIFLWPLLKKESIIFPRETSISTIINSPN